jgi:trans-aconitate methyltransferase
MVRLRNDLEHTREFFGPRAAHWDDRFHDDTIVYRAAIADIAPKRGGVVVDLGCGTGRALPLLREAVGPEGVVLGVDVTPEMLHVAHAKGRGALALADVTQLPVAPGRIDMVFAAGILGHVPDTRALLRALADATSRKAKLAVFHPIGRAARAARHQRTLEPTELLDPTVLPGVLAECGWAAHRIDDSDARYLAIATR